MSRKIRVFVSGITCGMWEEKRFKLLKVYYVCNDDSVDENLGPLFVFFLLFQSKKTIPNDVKGCYSRKLKSTKYQSNDER